MYEIYTKYQAAGPGGPARPGVWPPGGPRLRAVRPARRLVFCIDLVYSCIYLSIFSI